MATAAQPHPLRKPIQNRNGQPVERYDGPVCDSDPYPRVTAGTYEMRCIDWKIYRDPQFQRQVCRLAFSSPLVDEGATIYGFLNLGDGRDPGRRSRYRRAWVKANAGCPPHRGQKMSPRVFLNLWFVVEIGDVLKDSNLNPHSEGEIYSVVREILEVAHA